MKLKAWMTLVKLLLLLRGSHLPEARPSSVCRLSAAQLGTCVHKLLEQRQVSSAPQLTPNLLTTGLPQLPHTAEGWQRVRSRNRLPVPTGFKDRKVTFLISKRKMSGLQTIASDRGGGERHKMQLGVSLTIKLLHFLQINPRCEQHTVCCSRKQFSRSPLVPFSAWTEVRALLSLLFLMAAWLFSNCSSNHHLVFFFLWEILQCFSLY